MQRTMQTYFSRFGISGSQWGVLRNLYRAEEEGFSGLCLMDLGDRLLVRPPSVTGLIDRLERLGHVVRTFESSDLRRKEVRLTPTGRELVGRVLDGHGAQIAGVMGGLHSSDLTVLRELLEKIAAHLERGSNPRSGPY